MLSKVIEIKELKKYYGKIRGVELVNLTINKGEIYGFIGPNGSGKSTTIRTLMGLISKTSGEIFINGELIDYNDLSFKEKIGYLPSEINLYNDLTVKEMLDFHETFYNKDLKTRRNYLVNALKLDETKKVNELSLGNQKKLGIVLSLMHDPEIVIMDEATSGLDPIMQNAFYSILQEEKKRGKTILYSTHILSEVSKTCDKVGFIKDGIIIKEDIVSNLKHNNASYVTIYTNDLEKIKEDLNCRIIEENTSSIKFVNTLSPNELMNKLCKYEIDKLLIEEISLEDLFIEYYE